MNFQDLIYHIQDNGCHYDHIEVCVHVYLIPFHLYMFHQLHKLLLIIPVHC